MLTVSGSVVGKWIEISVSDNGKGIEPEHLDQVFEPFFTTKQDANAGSEGFGLGLAICKQIVETMGGRIAVDSTPSVGSTFTIQLSA